MKKLLMFLFLCLLCLTPQLSVDAEMANIKKVDVKNSKNAKKLYQHILDKGGTDWWAAAAVGNGFAESGLDPKTRDGHLGAFQMDLGYLSHYENWCKKHDREVNDVCAQYDYLITVYRKGCCTTITGLSVDKIYKDKKYIKDAESAAAYFTGGMEGCYCDPGGKWHDTHGNVCAEYDFTKSGGWESRSWQELKRRIENTEIVYNLFSGKISKGNSSGDSNEDGKETSEEGQTSVDSTQDGMIYAINCDGYYSEEDLSALIKMEEINIQGEFIDNANRNNLDQSALSNIENWEDNLEANSLGAKVVNGLRILTIVIGILFTIYVVLIYVAFWFDRLNNFVDIDAMGILTLGKLHASMEDKDSTFSLKNRSGQKVTMSHKQVFLVCLLGLSFGSFIITGGIFKTLGLFVNLMLRLFG